MEVGNGVSGRLDACLVGVWVQSVDRHFNIFVRPIWRISSTSSGHADSSLNVSSNIYSLKIGCNVYN